MVPEITKAVVFEGRERISIREVPLKPVKKGELLLKVLACSICGSDVRMLLFGHRRVGYPIIAGHELIGEVMLSRTKGFSEGEAVVVHPRIVCGKCHYCKGKDFIHCVNTKSIGFDYPGGFSEFLVVSEEGINRGNVMKVKEPREAYVLSEPLACVMRVYEDEHILRGKIAIIGDGPVAFLHAFFLKMLGVSSKIFVKNEWRAGFFRRKKFKIFYDDADFSEYFDTVIVCASHPSAVERAFRVVKRGGRIVAFSGIEGSLEDGRHILNQIHYREISITGIHASVPEHLSFAVAFIEKFPNIGEVITHRFPLENFTEAIDILKRKEAMKVIILPGGER